MTYLSNIIIVRVKVGLVIMGSKNKHDLPEKNLSYLCCTDLNVVLLFHTFYMSIFTESTYLSLRLQELLDVRVE